MAGTLKFWQAASAAKNVVDRSVESDMQAFACNLALNEYWEAYDWRESLATLPPFWMAPSVQDYGPPFVAVPDDFMALKRAYFVNLQSGTNGVPYRVELSSVGDLSLTQEQDLPTSICYLPQNLCFRIHPRMPLNWGAPQFYVDGQYKRKPSVLLTDGTTVHQVTASNIMAAYLPTEDRYFKVWVEGLKWAYMMLAGDPRAGGRDIRGGVPTFTGQYGIFEGAIDEMSTAELLNLKKSPVGPKNSLVMGGAGVYRNSLY
jgi:hypothetical protein